MKARDSLWIIFSFRAKKPPFDSLGAAFWRRTRRFIGRFFLWFSELGLDHVLELFQGSDLYDVAGWLGLEHGGFAGEGVYAFAFCYGWLDLDDDLAEAGQSERSRSLSAERLGDFIVERVEHCPDVLFGQSGGLGDVGVNFGLGGRLDC